MKFSKVTIAISLIIALAIILLIARFAYSIGRHNASFTVKEVTPKQIAEAMQSDNLYSKYTETMLLMSGTVKTVIHQDGHIIMQFKVTNSPSALGMVSCNLGSDQAVKAGAIVRILTVAHDIERQHTTDIFMPHCYVIK